jgi:hypothetical protein
MQKLDGIIWGALVLLVGSAEVARADTKAEPAAKRTASPKADRGGPTDGDPGGRAHCPRDVPAALKPPADATLDLALPARGVQIYVCAAPAAGGAAPAWTLKAPHAVLYQGLQAAVIHFAGPSWQALDGSLVTATKSASAPAPDGVAIPWLLLKAATHAGPGSFTDVTWIQRLATVGGAAPATGCDAAHLKAEVLVPYAADYFFYRAATAGKPVHQCPGT